MNETQETQSRPEAGLPLGAAHGSAFEAWWHNEGSGMPPLPGEDAETHVRRICEIAWVNGCYMDERSNSADRRGGARLMKTRKNASAPKFGAWSPPDTAPKNGTLLLGDFGWPWPLPAVWDEYDEQWVVASLQACPMPNGVKNSYLETETEKGCALKRWTPMPLLPNK